MIRLPHVSKFSNNTLNNILDHFPAIQQISTETREDFSGEFPLHTRYFSNGDWPLVALVKNDGYAQLRYDNNFLEIPNGSFVFFDDSAPHAWKFILANLEIYYYRFVDANSIAPAQGDYCLDNYF